MATLSAMLTAAMKARSKRKRGGKKLVWAMALLTAYFCVVIPAMVYLGAGPSSAQTPSADASFSSQSQSQSQSQPQPYHEIGARRLSSGGDCTGDEGGAGHAVGYLAIILYCFLGLAVICDDFFVPSLEAISERLNLSEDVAGATFMAAGSSAPELFTSVADAFGPRNSLGIGTIVGSAMFNILVIVAMSAAAAKQTLVIDWRPLVRDCAFYALALSLMTVCILTDDGHVEWYEGVIMVCGYLCYVGFMTINGRVFNWCDLNITKRCKKRVDPRRPTVEQLDVIKKALHLNDNGMPTDTSVTASGTGGTPSHAFTTSSRGSATVHPSPLDEGEEAQVVPISKDDLEVGTARGHAEGKTPGNPSTSAASTGEQAGSGDSKDGALSASGVSPGIGGGAGSGSAGGVSATRPGGDGDGDDDTKAVADEEMGRGAVAGTGDDVDRSDSKAAGKSGGDKAGDGDGDGAGAGDGGGEAEDGEDEDRFAWPDALGERILYVLSFPYLVMFTFTVPDVSKERWQRWYVFAFFMSIMWIGGLCWVMVELASQVGCILGIDPPVMGIVVLAVGTSIPDALGSMIVARQGEADMAIANAVGSNVFDILLGLGLPWFLSYFVHDEATAVDIEGISTGLVILYCTIVLFLGVIVLNKFRFNSNLGWVFLGLYVLYVTYTLLAEYCVSGIPVAGSRCDQTPLPPLPLGGRPTACLALAHAIALRGRGWYLLE